MPYYYFDENYLSIVGIIGFLGVIVAGILYLVRYKSKKGAKYQQINLLFALSLIFLFVGILSNTSN